MSERRSWEEVGGKSGRCENARNWRFRDLADSHAQPYGVQSLGGRGYMAETGVARDRAADNVLANE